MISVKFEVSMEKVLNCTISDFFGCYFRVLKAEQNVSVVRLTHIIVIKFCS